MAMIWTDKILITMNKYFHYINGDTFAASYEGPTLGSYGICHNEFK